MLLLTFLLLFFFSSRRRHTILQGDWSSDVCSSDLAPSRISLAAAKSLCAPSPGWTHSRLSNWLTKYCDKGCRILKSLSAEKKLNVPGEPLCPRPIGSGM